MKIQARRRKTVMLTFGSLAAVTVFSGGRPIALRPRFSPGLPLSLFVL